MYRDVCCYIHEFMLYHLVDEEKTTMDKKGWDVIKGHRGNKVETNKRESEITIKVVP